MKSSRIAAFILCIAAVGAVIYAETSSAGSRRTGGRQPEAARAAGGAAAREQAPGPAAGTVVDTAVAKAVKWLVSVQGDDGGWGQDGGETSYVRQGERLESSGNDVANTAVALTALLRAARGPNAGAYRDVFQRGLGFVLSRVEQSPAEGLAVTNVTGTQIQRKLGPYIDTFLTSKLLGELDGNMGDAQANARVRRALQKCVAKIEKSQLKDGSWNLSGGWAPILGTSLASQSLHIAQQKGVVVQPMALARVDDYTKRTAAAGGVGTGAGSGVGAGGGVVGGVIGGAPSAIPAPAMVETASVAAGIPLYKSAQELEQLSRTPADRAKNAKQIAAVTGRLADRRFVSGFGSIGGEEFFSYLNISDSLRRTGGPAWEKWNKEMTASILGMQNEDGTWAGHHCITGRVAVTSAAILMLRADREPDILTSSLKK
jgi:hypothetical protein